MFILHASLPAELPFSQMDELCKPAYTSEEDDQSSRVIEIDLVEDEEEA